MLDDFDKDLDLASLRHIFWVLDHLDAVFESLLYLGHDDLL